MTRPRWTTRWTRLGAVAIALGGAVGALSGLVLATAASATTGTLANVVMTLGDNLLAGVSGIAR